MCCLLKSPPRQICEDVCVCVIVVETNENNLDELKTSTRKAYMQVTCLRSLSLSQTLTHRHTHSHRQRARTIISISK